MVNITRAGHFHRTGSVFNYTRWQYLLTLFHQHDPASMSLQICKGLCVKSQRNTKLWLIFFSLCASTESLIWSRSLMSHICSLYCRVKRASAVRTYKWNQRRVKAKHSPQSIFQYLTLGTPICTTPGTLQWQHQGSGVYTKLHTQTHTSKRLVAFR